MCAAVLGVFPGTCLAGNNEEDQPSRDSLLSKAGKPDHGLVLEGAAFDQERHWRACQSNTFDKEYSRQTCDVCGGRSADHSRGLGLERIGGIRADDERAALNSLVCRTRFATRLATGLSRDSSRARREALSMT